MGPPIKQMVYDMVTRSMLVYSEHVDKRLLVVREDGMVLASYSCHVQGLRPSPTQRNCFILHGPMVSYVVLDKPSERPVTVSNFEGKGFARLLACAGDASFLATSAGQTQVLLTPQDDKLPQKWIEAHAGELFLLLRVVCSHSVRLRDCNDGHGRVRDTRALHGSARRSYSQVESAAARKTLVRRERPLVDGDGDALERDGEASRVGFD
jgi:hypothetical protein